MVGTMIGVSTDEREWRAFLTWEADPDRDPSAFYWAGDRMGWCATPAAPAGPEFLGEIAAAIQREMALSQAEYSADSGPVLLTQDQLAQALGCSTRTVFTLRERGCPHLLLLESPRFLLPDVLRWIDNMTKLRANQSQ